MLMLVDHPLFFWIFCANLHSVLWQKVGGSSSAYQRKWELSQLQVDGPIMKCLGPEGQHSMPRYAPLAPPSALVHVVDTMHGSGEQISSSVMGGGFASHTHLLDEGQPATHTTTPIATHHPTSTPPPPTQHIPTHHSTPPPTITPGGHTTMTTQYTHHRPNGGLGGGGGT